MAQEIKTYTSEVTVPALDKPHNFRPAWDTMAKNANADFGGPNWYTVKQVAEQVRDTLVYKLTLSVMRIPKN